MVDYNLIEDIGLDDAELTSLLAGIQSGSAIDGAEPKSIEPGSILKGRVVGMSGDFVIVDVGLKSEGQVDKAEFEDTGVAVGDEVEVLLEQMEDSEGSVVLSKRKADRIRGWEQILVTRKEGDIVEGKVLRKIN